MEAWFKRGNCHGAAAGAALGSVVPVIGTSRGCDRWDFSFNFWITKLESETPVRNGGR
jgi:hypothetical protein